MPYRFEHRSRVFRGKGLCFASGISVFSDKAEAIDVLKSTGPLRAKKLATGVILPSSGLILGAERTSHLTWWLYQGQRPHELFTVCSEERLE